MCLGGFAKAHPHVFVDARTSFIFNDAARLKTLRISWTYDAFTTLVLFETLQLDKDGNGMLSEADISSVIEGETVWPPGYKGDVYLDVSGRDYPLGRPEAVQVVYENSRLEVSFDLPLSEPVELTSTPAILRLYDPLYYYSYTILPSEPVFELPDGCTSKLIRFEPDAAARAWQEELAALSREEIPDQADVGRSFSDEVRLTCG